MEVEELRIGNLVQRHELTPIETISVITELSIETDFTNLLGIEHFEPIPLTEEWLIKFGFEKHELTRYYIKNIDERYLAVNHNYVHFGSDLDEVELGDYGHVHQLQNLYFALTGEELELKNN